MFTGVSIDWDEVAKKVCEDCDYIKTVYDRSGDYGMAVCPPEERCPAGAPMEGSFKYDQEEEVFYCEQGEKRAGNDEC